jgi:hypothetical protein
MVELGKVANFVGQVAELAALAELVCAGLFAPPTLPLFSPSACTQARMCNCTFQHSYSLRPQTHEPPWGIARSHTLAPRSTCGTLFNASCFASHQALAYVFSRINKCVCARTNVCIVCALCVRMYVRMCMNVCTFLCVRRLPGRGGD